MKVIEKQVYEFVKKSKRIYKIINLAMICLTVIIFMQDYSDVSEFFDGMTMISSFILIGSTILVHAVKAGRLYLALYGTGIELNAHLKIYCKVIPVSVVFPYKIGEFFRMYCYGTQLGNPLTGIVIILFDRFVDTAALVTAILLVWLLSGGKVTSLVYILLIFLAFVLFVYGAFPKVCIFWKKYLLKAKATENSLAVLAMLERANTLYHVVENVVVGRGIILYFMSLIAWGVEIGSVALLSKMLNSKVIDIVITNYLTSAMSGNQSIELRQFIFTSVVLLTAFYLIIKILEKAGKKVYK